MAVGRPKGSGGMVEMMFEKKITLGNVLELAAMIIAVILFITSMQGEVQAVNQKTEQMNRDLQRIEEQQKQFVSKDVYLELKSQMDDIKKSLETMNNKIDRISR
jgi:predicted nuclease with TOPRIM domain